MSWGFQRNQSTSQILIICQIIEGAGGKNLKATHSFVDFFKTFGFFYRGKMEQILLAYGLHKEIVTVIMIFYKNMKAMVCLPDSDTNFQHCHCSLARKYISIDYVLRTSIDHMKVNGLSLKEARSTYYPAETITDTDNLALLKSRLAQANCLLHNLEQEVKDIGLNMNLDKTEFLYLKQDGTIYTLNSKALKLVRPFHIPW